MRVRCSARADYRSNAVGELELECTSEGLCIKLCGVSSYREGYAPGPPVRADDVCVPWPGVYATRLGDRQLQLSVDARNLPLNRFLLGEFSERTPDAASGLKSSALPLGLAAAGLIALGVCLALARALPHARAIGTLGWAALVVAMALGAIAWRARVAPRAPAHVVLDELCHDLAQHVPHHISVAAPTPAPRSFEPVALSTLLPRSTVAIAITLAAATLAALVGSGAARPRSAGSDPDSSHGEPASVATPTLPTAQLDGSESMARSDSMPLSPAAASADCSCSRQESLLWQARLPRLSPVIVSERGREHDGHQHTELELALVNDGKQEARQIAASVVFFEARAGERAGQWQTGERPLFFAGPLAPGEATEWHVEGRGTSFDVIAPDFGMLAADGSDAAPAEAFARLASAGSRALRLHATRLLAFLGDARAESAGRALRASASPAETDYLDRLFEPPRDVVACELHVFHEANVWRGEACAFNRADRATSQLGLRLLAFDAPLDPLRPGARAPSLLAEHTARLPAVLPARNGRRVELSASLSIAAGRMPRAFELYLENRSGALP